jgi:hypothetical protein
MTLLDRPGSTPAASATRSTRRSRPARQIEVILKQTAQQLPSGALCVIALLTERQLGQPYAKNPVYR